MARHNKISDATVADFIRWYDWHPDRSVHRAFRAYWEEHFDSSVPDSRTIASSMDVADIKAKSRLTMTQTWQFQALPEVYKFLRDHEDVADELINSALKVIIQANTNQN